MKILITGITGFIGQNLLPKMGTRDQIFVVCLKPVTGLPDNVFVIEADLNEPESLFDRLKIIRPDVCVHLAWEGIPDYGYEVSVKNLKNSANFFRFLIKECGCRKIVSTGSCWEYGKSFGLCTETDPVGAGSYFVWAKRALCDLGLSLAREEKIDFIWLRLFYIYGPGQRDAALIPTLVRALRKDQCPQIRTPLDANDFVHVDDVAQAITKSVFSEVPSGIYNVGSGVSSPVWRVCATIEQCLNKNTAYFEQLKKVPCTQTADFRADTKLTSKVLGWQAKKSLEDGIREYLKQQGAQQ